MSELIRTDIVSLAGGLGKRLQVVTGGGQKVLARIDGKPFLEILIDYIAAQGGRRFILCTGHGAAEVEAYFHQARPDLEIAFSREDEPLGTGGAIKKGAALVRTPHFLAMNGDCFCVIDYNALIRAHQSKSAQATIAVTQVPDARDYGTIESDAGCRITAFREKQSSFAKASADESSSSAKASADVQYLINTGTYCFNRNVFDLVATPAKFAIEYDFFAHLIGKPFYSFEVDHKFSDIGTPERYAWATEHLKGLTK